MNNFLPIYTYNVTAYLFFKVKSYLKRAGIVMAKKGIYKIIFVQLGEIYEIFAKAIYQSEMYGFIEVEEYLFDQNSQIVVDPSEEKLKAEFKGVNRSYIPISCVLRIDEVDKKGSAKIKPNKGNNVMPIMSPIIDGGSQKKD
jgi:hypothetical protein